jgi:uncharacterized membrane protein
MCERIAVRVPVDFSILVTWGIVAFAVAGEAWACQNFEIGGLPFHFALSCFHNFTVWPYFSIYYSCVSNAKVNLWLNNN